MLPCIWAHFGSQGLARRYGLDNFRMDREPCCPERRMSIFYRSPAGILSHRRGQLPAFPAPSRERYATTERPRVSAFSCQASRISKTRVL